MTLTVNDPSVIARITQA